MVFDGVVGAAGQMLGDLGPFVTHLRVQVVEQLVFGVRPSCLFDVGIEMVVPAFATLLAQATAQMLGYERPAFGSVLGDELDDFGVLFFGPRTFDQIGIKDFLPALLALVFGARRIHKVRADELPVLEARRILFAQTIQGFVFVFRPAVLGLGSLREAARCLRLLHVAVVFVVVEAAVVVIVVVVVVSVKSRVTCVCQVALIDPA